MTNLQSDLFSQIVQILTKARQNVVQTVNTTMVQAYFEIGRMIVEDEQNGNDRAEYGKKQLANLSEQLTAEFGKGFSERNLKNMRQFYLVYSQSRLEIANKSKELAIRQKVSAEFKKVRKCLTN